MKKYSLVFLFLLISCSHADDELKYSCARPMKQDKFVENRDIDRYNSEVQNYKSCVDEFVLTNKEIIANRSDAISDAINDWNDFVAGKSKKHKEDREFTGSTGVPLGGSHTIDHSDPSKISTGWRF